MSELCLSSTSRTYISSLLTSCFFLFFSFIISHPLYFTYFIFFSPYILKLLSFLSPLFITTSLLILAFLTLSPSFINDNSSRESSDSTVKIKLNFLTATYHAVLQRLRFKTDDHNNEEPEILCLENFEVFKIVFDNPMIQASEAPDNLACSGHQDFLSLSSSEELEKSAEPKTNWGVNLMEEEKRLECFLQELDEFEKVSVEKKKIEAIRTEASKVIEKGGQKSLLVSNGSEKAHSESLKIQSSPPQDYNLGGYGSVRKEKDWKRTLACKLFEERHNGDEGERMDLLWETYEVESSKKNKANGKNRKKSYGKKCDESISYDGQDQEDDLDEQLCCLQALKFSAGKMNLGMGRPNLVKISKAIKGIGWLHNLKRHSKKVHNGDRF